MEKNKVFNKFAYKEFCKPLTAHLLEALKLDKIYTKAIGNNLFYTNDNGKEILVHDFVGGYGANICGHNNPEIIAHIKELLDAQTPVHAQLSNRNAAGELAVELNKEFKATTGKDFIFTFANSGTEAVEAAIKHALLAYSMKVIEFRETFEMESANLKADCAKFTQKKTCSWKGKIFDNPDELICVLKTENDGIIRNNLPQFIALQKSFHGKTLGSLNLTQRREYRRPFLADTSPTFFLETEIVQHEELIANSKFNLYIPQISISETIKIKCVPFNRVAAIFVEPIQGEGGVRELTPEFLKGLKTLSVSNDIPLVFDEIQSGFFRTGNFLASEKLDITADYYIIGKSLGGSFSKISACVIDKTKYIEPFGLLHTSTFAEDEFSAKVALKAFFIAKNARKIIVEKGSYLHKSLDAVKEQFPEVIKEIRGEGLMVGIEFHNFKNCSGYGLQVLSRSGYLGYVISGYLLNNFNIRVASALSADFTMRIQPSFAVENTDIDQLVEGLKSLCTILKYQDLYKLLEYILPPNLHGLRSKPEDFSRTHVVMDDVPEGTVNVGFLTHYINAETLKISDPSLKVLNAETIEYILDEITQVASPAILGRKLITDKNGQQIAATFIGLPFTSRMCKKALVSGNTNHYIRLCNDAAKILKKEYHALVVGLGQFTSIITNNGKSIADSELAITTGNSYTVFAGLAAMKAAAKNKKIEYSNATTGVIGAAGNISVVYAQCFADECKKVYLFGSPTDAGFLRCVRTARAIYAEAFRNLLAPIFNPKGNLEKTLSETELYKNILKNHELAKSPALLDMIEKELGNQMPVVPAKSMEKLLECNLVVSATNAPDAFLKPSDFSENTVICDISVPINCTDELLNNTKNIEVILGGVIALPNKEAIPVAGFPLPSGHAYACISETMLLGFENFKHSFSYGLLNKSQVYEIGEIAEKHGFTFGGMKKESSY